ncbi:uncharacterized protein LOC116610226 [Nematostella vectensis]|uniref:uncharacterized protein LOC116610226 n=1 Tax=Nematostella vectensis TaxID=45351 RepID=UPI002077021A|nr:uncharacterized protein LOC116610226 [Nematostella vectensis]
MKWRTGSELCRPSCCSIGKHVEMSKRTVFNNLWLQDPLFPWVAQAQESTKARCKMCSVTFELGNMGKQALISHAKGKKHLRRVAPSTQQLSLNSFVTVQKQESEQNSSAAERTMTVPPPPVDLSQVASSSDSSKGTIKKYVTKDETLKAEVLWAIKVLMSHYSCNSSAGTDKLFSNMFPDSVIAKQFQCGATKCSYLICFGIAPFFHDELMKRLQEQGTMYVISFDESLNKVIQKEQMDLIVRFWDVQKNKVVSRYIDSQFLGHTRAADLLQSFKLGLQKLNPANLVQVSMDGPNVNWKFLEDLLEDREQTDPDLPKLINIGACGLHVVHGAFKYGATATGWRLDKLLRSLWYTFSDSPAKREDYEAISGSSMWPLRFCGTRWLEDLPVAERAVAIWPNIKKYVDEVSKLPKSKIPTSQSFKNLQAFVQDPLIVAKLEFFISIARILGPFLKKFQTDQPMVPFLTQDVQTILEAILSKFVKKSVLQEATTCAKLANIDVSKSDNLLPPRKVDVGFAAKMSVHKMESTKQATPLQILKFQNNCLEFLKQLSSKVMDRSPLKYKMARNLVSLNPIYMASNPEAATTRFSNVLQQLISHKMKSTHCCDIALQQYKAFLADVERYSKEDFKSYQSSDKALDVFLAEYFHQKPQYADLWQTVKMLLILSHGQSCVERGFSDNKDIVSNNMHQDTLVGFRRAHSGVKSLECPIEDSITTELLTSCKYASNRYRQSLAEKKSIEAKTHKESLKRKVEEDIKQAKKKKQKLETTATALLKEADDLATNAEMKGDFSILAKSNALRVKSKEKRKEIEKEEQNIDLLQKKLKSF